MNLATRDYSDFHSPLDHIRAKHLSSAELRLHADKLATIQGWGFSEVIRDEADRVEMLERLSLSANQTRRQTVSVELEVGDARRFISEVATQPQQITARLIADALLERIARLPAPITAQERLW